MTITAQTSKTGPYSGNGTTTVFSYTFEVQDEAHLVVTLADADGIETVQVLNTDYTVSGVGNANGGQITMTTAPASTYTLTLSRNVPITQEVDLENRRSVAPEVLEDAYDKLTQIAQDLSEQVGRAIKISVTEGGNPTLTLEGDVQPNTFLGFDASGNIAQLAPASGTFISPNAAIVAVDDFTGDGTTVDFTLGGIPQSPNNLFIFLDGVMQDAANYTVSGTTLTFTTAPPLNTNIEVRRLQAVALTGGTTADLVTYSPAGSGAVTRTVQSRLRDFVSVKDFGALGDGVTNDANAFTAANTASGVAAVYVPAGTYVITGTVTGNFFTFGVVTISSGSVNSIIQYNDLSSPPFASIAQGALADTAIQPADTQVSAQNTAVWQLGTGAVDSIVSPAKVKAAIDAHAPAASIPGILADGLATAGLAITANTWKTVPIDALQIDNIAGASLAANVITLPAGTYYVKWVHPISYSGSGAAACGTRLYNVTDAGVTLNGQLVVPIGASYSGNQMHGMGAFTLAGAKGIRVEGVANNGAVSLSKGLYLEIYKTA
jgi:hypothetical protein